MNKLDEIEQLLAGTCFGLNNSALEREDVQYLIDRCRKLENVLSISRSLLGVETIGALNAAGRELQTCIKALDQLDT